MRSEPLQEFSAESRREWDDRFDEALTYDVTQLFIAYLLKTVRTRGIVILCIKGFMRSSKSMASQTIGHMIRFFQKKYIDKELPSLKASESIGKNQSDVLSRISKSTNGVFVSDETKDFIGQGSRTEEKTIQNVLEICARELNHIIFIKPSAFVHPEVCKYGLEFFARDDNRKESVFILYDLGNVGGDGKQYPIGYVRLRKIVEPGYKPPQGKRYTSSFEEYYEEVIKEEIVMEQKRLESKSERAQRIEEAVKELEQTPFMTETGKINNVAERKNYRLAILKYRFSGRLIGAEINDILAELTGKETLTGSGVNVEILEGIKKNEV